jgi:hypothetical protein
MRFAHAKGANHISHTRGLTNTAKFSQCISLQKLKHIYIQDRVQAGEERADGALHVYCYHLPLEERTVEGRTRSVGKLRREIVRAV